MQIFVKTITGKTITIYTDEGENIRQLKGNIQDKTDIPIDQQHLIFERKEFDDPRTIGECNIVKESTVYM
eukprot:14748687-Heterocapsa_arctica.AAC.1